MKLSLLCRLAALFMVSMLASLMSASAQEVLALKGATVVDAARVAPLKNAVVLVEDGRITKVGRVGAVDIPGDARILDLAGKWIMPGLVDAHMHFSQSGGLYTRPDAIDLRDQRPDAYAKDRARSLSEFPTTLRRYVAAGVTAIVDVGGPISNQALRDKAAALDVKPRIALAGPLLATLNEATSERATRLDLGDDPTIITVRKPKTARTEVRKQKAAGVDLIKIWYIVSADRPAQSSYETVAAIIDEAHASDLRVAVHATDLDTAKLAVKAGADILVHTVDNVEVDEAFINAAKDGGVIVTTTAVVYEGFGDVILGTPELSTIEASLGDPQVIASWDEQPHENRPGAAFAARFDERISLMRANAKRLTDAGVMVAIGTDAGNPGTPHGPAIHREIALMADAGMSPAQILRAATLDAAAVFAEDADFGVIAPGMRADLLVVGADPLETIEAYSAIETVMVGGERFDPTVIAPISAEGVVERQLIAYNAHDLDAFVATYADDVELFRLPSAEPMTQGIAALEEQYGRLFEEVKPNCRRLSRLVEGSFVTDQEFCRFGDEELVRAIAIYQVENEKIRRVWFAQ